MKRICSLGLSKSVWLSVQALMKILESPIAVPCLKHISSFLKFCRELEHNNLTEVNKGWLYGLRMLQQLYVSQNAVERISPDAWEFCQRLSEL